MAERNRGKLSIFLLVATIKNISGISAVPDFLFGLSTFSHSIKCETYIGTFLESITALNIQVISMEVNNSVSTHMLAYEV